MTPLALVFAAALLVASVAAGGVTLTPDNFDSIVDGSKHAFVEFYAPWCGHCKSLAPEWEKLGDAFAKTSDVVIGAVDADAHGDLGSRFGVSGFPTLKFFAKGSTEPVDYSGGRTVEDMAKFVNEQAGTSVRIKKAPSAVHELTESNFESIVKDPAAHVLVEFFAPWCGHCKTLAPHYAKAAAAFKNEKNCRIAALDADAHRETAQAYGVSGYPTLKFFAKDDKSGEVKYEGERTAEGIVAYMNNACGTQRSVDGGFLPTAGRDATLDALAAGFAGAGAAEQEARIAKATAAVSAYEGGYPGAAAFYVQAMRKIAAKGDYATTEVARLQRMIEGAAVAAEKADEFALRINVLGAFQ